MRRGGRHALRRATPGALMMAVLATSAAMAQDPGARAALATLEGQAADPDIPVALAPWPGGPTGVLVIAALEDPSPSGQPLGTARVGLVTRQGNRFTLLASDEETDCPEPERVFDPSDPDIGIDGATFRIAPNEVAIGIDVGENLITTSINLYASSLLLYRRLHHRLVPIFTAATAESELDKESPNEPEQLTRHIVRFTRHMTRGFYDLVLQRVGARTGRTYVWNGARYVRR